jgi:glutamyl-tRNA synthetase
MIRTRFAPSPTGNLHIGGARTALFNWLFARRHGGEFILRIEDTDRERSKEEYTNDILDGLAWLGITHDGSPLFQSTRTTFYRENAYRLLDKGAAYKCYCTPDVLEEKRKKAISEGKKPSYDRTCRDNTVQRSGQPFVIRFKSPLEGTVAFDDLVRGHINNTPRQILMYKALGFDIPRFAHVPLIHGKDRTRLSKRHGAASLLEYRKDGFLPEALVNYLSRLGWAYGDQEIFSKSELVEKFDISHVGKSPAIFDLDKLLWVNSHYLKTLPVDDIANRMVLFIDKTGCPDGDKERLRKIVLILRERAKTLKEMAHMAEFFFEDRVNYEPKARDKYLTPGAKAILERFLRDLSIMPYSGETEQRALVEGIASDLGRKLVDIIQPIRVALSGREVTPGIFEVMDILGPHVVEKRIKAAISSIQ